MIVMTLRAIYSRPSKRIAGSSFARFLFRVRRKPTQNHTRPGQYQPLKTTFSYCHTPSQSTTTQLGPALTSKSVKMCQNCQNSTPDTNLNSPSTHATKPNQTKTKTIAHTTTRKKKCATDCATRKMQRRRAAFPQRNATEKRKSEQRKNGGGGGGGREGGRKKERMEHSQAGMVRSRPRPRPAME